MTCPTYYLLLLPLSLAGDEKHFWFRRAPELTRYSKCFASRGLFEFRARAFSLMDREEEKPKRLRNRSPIASRFSLAVLIWKDLAS